MSRALIVGNKMYVFPNECFSLRTHDEDECEGRTCVIHSPTQHHLSDWPFIYRPDRNMFERKCDHGIGHPDPDQYAYWLEKGRERAEEELERPTFKWWQKRREAEWNDQSAIEIEIKAKHFADVQMVHGCDGCCDTAKQEFLARGDSSVAGA